MKKGNNALPLSEEDKIFNRNKWFFSVGGIGRDMVYALVSNYFFMYVQFGLTLSVAQFATLSILIGVLGRIWDGINDPLMGTIIDGANFKWGKFKPWILLGAVLTGILSLVLFNVRPFGTQDIYGWIYVVIMVVVYLLWEAAFTMNDIGYWGAIPSLSRDNKKRDKLTSMVIFCAGIGSGFIALFVSMFSPGNVLNAYTIYSIVACVAIIGFQTMTAFTMKEGPVEVKKEEDKSSLVNTFKIIFRNKQLLWLAIGYLVYDIGSGILGALIYNLYYLEYGYDGTLAGVMMAMGMLTMVMQLLYPKFAKYLTREKIQRYSCILMGVGYVWIALLGWGNVIPFNPYTLSFGNLLISIGGTYFYITSLINLTNCVEYNEYLTGNRNEAIISSVRPLLVKFATATKSLLTTIILIFSGLYVLSQDVSNLETQRNLYNDKIETVEDMKFYVSKVNEYYFELSAFEEDSNEYNMMLEEIDNEILELENDVLKSVQIQAAYLDVYREMYILKYSNNEMVDFLTIKEISDDKIDTFFVNDCSYEATFVFSYEDVDGKIVNVNVATDVYKKSDTLTTRIILRIMVTLLPILLIILSYFIQTRKFTVDEKFYDMMMKELALRKKENEVEEA